jgi:hypothetical protein
VSLWWSVPDETPTPETEPRGADVARAEIRDDEAKRVIGLLAPGELPARAARWVADGLDDDAARELSAATGRPEEERVGLLERLAASQGLAFPSAREARAHHGQNVIASMTAASAAGDSLTFSNSFSDTIEESVRDSISRLFPRRKK